MQNSNDQEATATTAGGSTTSGSQGETLCQIFTKKLPHVSNGETDNTFLLTSEELQEHAEACRFERDRLSKDLDLIKTSLHRIQSEQCFRKWGVRVGSTVSLPDGRKFKVTHLQLNSDSGRLKPWAHGRLIKKNGELSNKGPQHLFNDWTVTI
jgi:hypothetical protein